MVSLYSKQKNLIVAEKQTAEKLQQFKETEI